MGKRLNPRHGSMQFWPRVRASRQYARVRSLPNVKEAKLLGFAGYKAGMTHVIVTDTGKNSITKGEKVRHPVTVIECPPLKISSVRFYSTKGYGVEVVKELFFKPSKEFVKKTSLAKTLSTVEDLDKVDLSNVAKISLQVYTQPKLTGFGKKVPEIFELGLGGSKEEQIDYIKKLIPTDINVTDIFKPGDLVDTRGVTKGKGFQGSVKRFGVNIRSHKSEKVIRGPGSLGGWTSQGHTMYRIAHAGQMGYHHRTQYNNQILAIVNPEEVNPNGGFLRYGEVKNPCILVKGSVQGAKKRLVTLTAPLRAQRKPALPTIDFISKESKQGN
jgi:large subunit ribosomal protein L3